MSKKLRLILITLLVILISVPAITVTYFKLFTDGSCGGVVGRVCLDGYYCKGATQSNEGAGTCTREILKK